MAAFYTRQTLGKLLTGHIAKHGPNTPVTALAKTNTKYMLAKKLGLGESPEAEHVAASKMRDLVENNQDLMKSDTFGAHYNAQHLDRQAHLQETSSPNNRYGPFTTGITNYVPTLFRALYSKATTKIPRISE